MDALDAIPLRHEADFAAELTLGLTRSPKAISPKFFYDHAGSLLFEQICALPEYYITRTELPLLQRHAADFAALIGAGAELIEFGAGAGAKIRVILDALQRPSRFIPIDISTEYLASVATDLRLDYPDLSVDPLAADFTRKLSLGPAVGRRVGFFPGSTIGISSRRRRRNS